MSSAKDDFLRLIGQTSPNPIGLQVSRAEGCFIYDQHGKRYYDLISGFSVSNIGHGHPGVLNSITDQANCYLHTMVYGELIQQPQLRLARLLTENLPPSLNQVYFVNSGAEAVEGAMKLAKRITGRPNLVSFQDGYHGSTQGALSLMGNEKFKTAFRPLLPGISIIRFNEPDDLNLIDNQTAAVFIEPIQAEAGIRVPDPGYLKKLKTRCEETGSLLVYDEIQTGFGRTGKLFCLEHSGVVPDILLLAKALGGGMPLGAIVADRSLLSAFTHDPPLGHVTTFGGHPVSCAAGEASLSYIISEELAAKAAVKENWFRSSLIHPSIREIRGCGLFLALQLQNSEQVSRFFSHALDEGILFDYFLFCNDAVRVAPPLIIDQPEADDLAVRILRALDRSA